MANIVEMIVGGSKYGGLRHMVLYALAQGPKNGVEIMNTIESMCFGTYKPSPGSVYPLLGKLAEEGLIKKSTDGRYEITAAGLESGDYQWHWQWWDHGPYTPYNVIGDIESNVRFLEDAGAEKLVTYADRLDAVIARLQKLKAWTEEAARQQGNGQKTC